MQSGRRGQAVADYYREYVDRVDPLRCQRGAFRDRSSGLSAAWALIVECATGLPVEGFADDPLTTDAANRARNHVAGVEAVRRNAEVAASASLDARNAEARARHEAEVAEAHARTERITALAERADGTV